MAEALSSSAVQKSPRRLGALAWTAVVAAIALASSSVALIFEIWPGLRPDPRTQLGADVSVFAVDPHVTRDAYLEHLPVSPSELQRLRHDSCGKPPPCGGLHLVGEEVYVRTLVEGFKRRSISMRVSLYNSKSKTRVTGASDVDVASQRLDAPSDRAVIPIWIPCPPDASKRYFVRVELYHRGDDVLLAVADSKSYRTSC